MRWGAFGSLHCGHEPVLVAVSVSCVRRLAVRVFECRRFGFGIDLRFPANQPLERGQAGILPFGRAGARPGIPVGAALRAQSFTVVAALSES